MSPARELHIGGRLSAGVAWSAPLCFRWCLDVCAGEVVALLLELILEPVPGLESVPEPVPEGL